MPVSGAEHNSSRNLENSKGIRRLHNFFGKHDIFQKQIGTSTTIFLRITLDQSETAFIAHDCRNAHTNWMSTQLGPIELSIVTVVVTTHTHSIYYLTTVVTQFKTTVNL